MQGAPIYHWERGLDTTIPLTLCIHLANDMRQNRLGQDVFGMLQVIAAKSLWR
jgi:hypothetical protein